MIWKVFKLDTQTVWQQHQECKIFLFLIFIILVLASSCQEKQVVTIIYGTLLPFLLFLSLLVIERIKGFIVIIWNILFMLMLPIIITGIRFMIY